LADLFEHPAPPVGQGGEGGLVRRFQRYQDVGARLEEQRHVPQHVTHGERLDVGPQCQRPLVGDQGEGFAGGGGVVLAAELFPDRSVDSLGIAGRGRVQVDDE